MDADTRQKLERAIREIVRDARPELPDDRQRFDEYQRRIGELNNPAVRWQRFWAANGGAHSRLKQWTGASKNEIRKVLDELQPEQIEVENPIPEWDNAISIMIDWTDSELLLLWSLMKRANSIGLDGMRMTEMTIRKIGISPRRELVVTLTPRDEEQKLG